MRLRHPPSLLIARGLVLGGLVGGLIACDGERHSRTTEACAGRPVRMAVASSLKEIATDLVDALQSEQPLIEIELILGASSTHARQLTLGAPVDLIVSADAEIIDTLRARQLVVPDSIREIARGRLVLLARHEGAKTARDAALDAATLLAHPDLESLAIPSAAVPLGRYARSWLASRALLERLAGRIVTTEHARATLAAVEASHVEFAIVYASDARLAHRSRAVAEIDPAEHPPIRYVIARSQAAPACDAIESARASWSSSEVRGALQHAGFLAPLQESIER